MDINMNRINEHLEKQIGNTVTLSAKKLFYILSPDEEYKEIRYELLKILKKIEKTPPEGFVVDDIRRVNNRLKVILRKI